MEIRRLLTDLMLVSDPALLSELEAVAQIRRLKKGEHTIRIGEMQTKLYIMISGVVRCYFLDGLNQEYTDCFITEPGYPVMTASISEPSLITAQAVVPTTLLELPMGTVARLMQEYTELLWLYNALLQKSLFFHWQIKTARYTYDALQRYVWFRKSWPEVERYANSRHIASFLGMTPETLSRMRHAVKNDQELVEMLSDPNSELDSSYIMEQVSSGRRQNGSALI